MKLFKRPDEPEERHDYDLHEVMQIAAEGRKLVIFDRATGLYAFWYLQLRGTEEVSRAKRHHRGLHCVSIWAPAPDLVEQVRLQLHDGLRDHDLAAYLNNGHFAVLLTETDGAGAEIVRQRLLGTAGAAIAIGVASYPEDGSDFDALLEIAKQRAETPGGNEAAA